MDIQLTPQQQQAISAEALHSTRVIDPRNNTAYVLVPEAEYRLVQDALAEERRREIIHATAVRNAAGRLDDTP